MTIIANSAQADKAYYYNSIQEFITDSPERIVGQLVRHSFEVNKEQSDAWYNQIYFLQKGLAGLETDGYIVFEYNIIRLGKRIDVVLIIHNVVFTLEFKNGKKEFTSQDAKQAEDYAIDIKNFHKESKDLYVCPILVATDALTYKKGQPIDCYPDNQIFLQRENSDSLFSKIATVVARYGNTDSFSFEKWFNSPYYPTPTIIDAAIQAYATHDISEIANSEAGQDDIRKCENEIETIINYAEHEQKKCICFVTGVPGAGKTLVGLDTVAHSLKTEKSGSCVYLSGNGPLVQVLKEALKKSVEIKKQKQRHTEEAINALIQSSFTFKNAHAFDEEPIAEKILIFDEAQRVWDQSQMQRKHKTWSSAPSEPNLLYSIMDRHEGWTVMICLVGLGQDIYDGEVGINEWFRCGIEEYTQWELFYSPDIFSQVEDKSIDKDSIQGCSRCHAVPNLHLKTSVRSFRADKQSQFVDTLLDNNPSCAKEYYDLISDVYPVYITRNFKLAKEWIKSKVRGSQRSGILACSSAQRLKPEGIYVAKDIDVKNWFLAPSEDLRSSNMMEIVASEFKVQGLEIDWAIVCWDADLRRAKKNSGWDYYSFRGTRWNQRNKESQKRYLVNSYRVLLTRARQGMVIFVPYGCSADDDPTRDRTYYDNVYSYLLSCGIKELNEGHLRS